MNEKILILDFGSQYTQLIARSVREANVYCEIIPFHQKIVPDPTLKGYYFVGFPFLGERSESTHGDVKGLHRNLPILGICYGAQLTAKEFGGRVANSNKREYGRALMSMVKQDILLQGVNDLSQVWMSHADTILELPAGFDVLAKTDSIPYAAFRNNGEGFPLYCLQFHPEVYHSTEGKKIIRNFLVDVCGCKQDWTAAHFISDTVDCP